MDCMELLCIMFCTFGTIHALNQAVWLEDITQNAKTRNLDLGLPETLQFKLRRTGQQDLILKLWENKRLTRTLRFTRSTQRMVKINWSKKKQRP
ncbi:hypothetical protein DPMN_072796 [Dreissena polymorpha]|uniref:Uncharacterized protein n=1 Tax=Dreissena polymorpha TaxID=45954 RepID=A0A9D4BXZ7_DREPO|nr:hypothetical protein DPMN_072796 [Dreissena polymorpha]